MKRRIRMNLRVSDFAKTGKPCVYRYVDKKDGIETAKKIFELFEFNGLEV